MSDVGHHESTHGPELIYNIIAIIGLNMSINQNQNQNQNYSRLRKYSIKPPDSVASNLRFVFLRFAFKNHRLIPQFW